MVESRSQHREILGIRENHCQFPVFGDSDFTGGIPPIRSVIFSRILMSRQRWPASAHGFISTSYNSYLLTTLNESYIEWHKAQDFKMILIIHYQAPIPPSTRIRSPVLPHAAALTLTILARIELYSLVLYPSYF